MRTIAAGEAIVIFARVPELIDVYSCEFDGEEMIRAMLLLDFWVAAEDVARAIEASRPAGNRNLTYQERDGYSVLSRADERSVERCGNSIETVTIMDFR